MSQNVVLMAFDTRKYPCTLQLLKVKLAWSSILNDDKIDFALAVVHYKLLKLFTLRPTLTKNRSSDDAKLYIFISDTRHELLKTKKNIG